MKEMKKEITMTTHNPTGGLETCPVRVLIVENNAKTATYLQKNLEVAGYACEVAVGMGAALIEKAREVADDFRPHVAIVDLRISGVPEWDQRRRDDLGGLEVLRALQDTCCILRSGWLTHEVTDQAHFEGITYRVIDTNVSVEKLKQLVAEAADNQRPCRRGFSIHWSNAWSASRVAKVLVDDPDYLDSVEDVIGYLFEDDSDVRLEPLDDALGRSGSLSRGRSAVFRAWRPKKNESVIVKLALRDKIEREAENYNSIEGDLRGNFKTVLQKGPACLWSVGGLRYSNVSSEAGTVQYASLYRQNDNFQTLVRPLEHFYQHVWIDLYQNSQPLTQTMFEAHDALFVDLVTSLQKSRQQPAIIFQDLPLTLPEPIAWLLRNHSMSTVPSARIARVHGDLHANNLFANDRYAWPIDFGRTGFGPRLIDFAELEVDILTRLVEWPTDGYAQFLRTALVLTQPIRQTSRFAVPRSLLKDASIRKALVLISEIRRLARRTTHYSDFREYLWTLLIDAVYASTVGTRYQQPLMPRQERALLLAAVLCKRMDEGSSRWNPQEWRQAFSANQDWVLISYENGRLQPYKPLSQENSTT